jgi:hypothetical protein
MGMVIKIRIPEWVVRVVVWPMEVYHSLRLWRKVRVLPLSKGKFAIVEAADYEELNKYKWFVQESSGAYYAVCRMGKERVWMHRYLMNAPKDKKVDHKNNHTLDNRRENLRLASTGENNKNRRKMRGNFSSKYKGVFWNEKRKRWFARINVDGKLIHIGSFKKEKEAAKAYDAAAKKYHKVFARGNFS